MLEKSGSQLVSNRLIFIVIVSLIVVFVIDTTFAISYDLVSKTALPTETKKIIFGLNIIICLILQFIIILYTTKLTQRKRLSNRLGLKVFEKVGRFAYYLVVAIVTYLIFQLFYYDYYYSSTIMLIVLVTYSTCFGLNSENGNTVFFMV